MGERNFERVPDEQLEIEIEYCKEKIEKMARKTKEGEYYGNEITIMTRRKEGIEKEQKERLFGI